MNHIEDELLNKYLDNELNSNEISLLNEHLRECDECLTRLKGLKVVDHQLKKLDISHVRADFTEMIMRKINQTTVKFAPKKFYFFRFIYRNEFYIF